MAAQHDSEEESNPLTMLGRQEEEVSPPATPKFLTDLVLCSIKSSMVIEQMPSEGVSHKIWQAATSLITHLDKGDCPTLSNLFQARDNNVPYRILELGSGTGVVGIAAAALLGANVTVTDLPSVVPNLQRQIDANAGILQIKGGTVNAEELRWGDVGQMEVLGREYDYILATDLLYNEVMFRPLLDTLRWFILEKKNIMVLMAHLKRFKFENRFWKKARKHFEIKLIHTDEPIDGERVGVMLYKFVAKGST